MWPFVPRVRARRDLTYSLLFVVRQSFNAGFQITPLFTKYHSVVVSPLRRVIGPLSPLLARGMAAL